MLSVIKDYLTLDLSAKDFARQMLTNDDLVAFIQSRLPQSRDADDSAWKGCPLQVRAFAYDDFDVRKTLTTGYYALTKASRCATAYRMLYRLFQQDLPEITQATYYSAITSIALDAVPDTLDSPEAGSVIFDVITATEGIPASQRKKAVKATLTEAFHLGALAKKPRWLQGSEWPVSSSGKPMRFIGQTKAQGEKVDYTFEDTDTLEKRIITQYT